MALIRELLWSEEKSPRTPYTRLPDDEVFEYDSIGGPSSPIMRTKLANGQVGHHEDDIYHCHTKSQKNLPNYAARRTLIIASVICLLFMLAEIVGGLLAGSLAIITDAAHLLTDFASFLISLFSLFVASRPASKRMSFGWHRAEVLGAFVSVLLIWVVTGVLVYIAIERIVAKSYSIDAEIMLITAAIGVSVNIIITEELNTAEVVITAAPTDIKEMRDGTQIIEEEKTADEDNVDKKSENEMANKQKTGTTQEGTEKGGFGVNKKSKEEKSEETLKNSKSAKEEEKEADQKNAAEVKTTEKTGSKLSQKKAKQV